MFRIVLSAVTYYTNVINKRWTWAPNNAFEMYNFQNVKTLNKQKVLKSRKINSFSITEEKYLTIALIWKYNFV